MFLPLTCSVIFFWFIRLSFKGWDLLWHSLGLLSFSFQPAASDMGVKPQKNPSLSYSFKTQPIKKQTYLVSLPHLLDRSCHSRAGSWPQVAPLYSALQASPRYLLSVIRVLISLVHTVRRTAQTQVAGFIASTHLSELFKLPRARGAYNLFQLRERNGWSGKAAIPDQTVT